MLDPESGLRHDRAMTFLVRLPRHQPPLFPPECIGCGEEEPRHSVTLWAWSVSLWAALTLLAALWSKTAKATAPCCARCGWRLRLRRLVSVAYFAAAVAVAVYGQGHWLPKMPRLFSRLIAMAGCGLLLVPWAIVASQIPAALTL